MASPFPLVSTAGAGAALAGDAAAGVGVTAAVGAGLAGGAAVVFAGAGAVPSLVALVAAGAGVVVAVLAATGAALAGTVFSTEAVTALLVDAGVLAPAAAGAPAGQRLRSTLWRADRLGGGHRWIEETRPATGVIEGPQLAPADPRLAAGLQ